MQPLSEILQCQRAAFARAAPGYRQRMDALAMLHRVLQQHKEHIVQAVSEDFGGRSREETLMFELFALLAQIRHAQRHLKRWMKTTAVASAWFLQPSRTFFQYQALGVAGIIGAWNFPFLLVLSPLIDALAAGNHVMLKPSDVTPRSAEVTASLIAACFPADYVACVTGDVETAREFSRLPFNHLLVTGSAATGKQVLQAAAANLTPVTLELGGKSPVIVHESFPLRLATRRIMTAKLFNAGQTCIAPDYLLLPEQHVEAFEREARQVVASLYPNLAENPDYTRIVNSRHFHRLSGAVEDAVSKGARVSVLGGGSDQKQLFPPTLVFSPTKDMTVMQEEVFGPILPVVTYRSLDEALAFVNSRPHALALYYFDNNKRRVRELIRRTQSGGVTVNDCIFHFGQPNLPFGGIGSSGMGQYHGFDGFVTFSKKRGVMVQSWLAATALLHAPFTRGTKALVNALLKIGG